MRGIFSNHDNTPVPATWRPPAAAPPGTAGALVVGGGIAGCSVAYHLAARGWDDVVLLEQNRIASGTTWHSAGQVGQLRASSVQTRINKASAELYAELESLTGHPTGWLQCGGLQLATSADRWTQLQRNAALAKVFAVEAHLLTPDEIAARWPVLEVGDVQGAIWLPGDGRVLPGECTVALAKAALQAGATICEHTAVEELLVRDGRARGVRTPQGIVSAEWVVLACGMWTRRLAVQAGIDVPLFPCEHHYLVTAPVEGIDREFPCCRDPDAGIYFRSLDDGGMKLGAFKHRSKPWRRGETVPGDFAFSLLEPDWEDFAEPLALHHHRVPATRDIEIVKFVNGPESFTPDNSFLMGEPAGLRGLFVLAGFNSAGIACAGGAGRFAAEWMENEGMTEDLLSVDLRRFGPKQNQLAFLKERVSETLGLHYAMAWPGRQMETARSLATTPLFDRHLEHGARLGEVAGIERPLWFGGPALNYTFDKPAWLEQVSREVRTCRDHVAVFDQSTFAKFETGDLDGLQWLCANNIDVEPGRAVYTALLNERGTFESDLIVVRRRRDQFYLVSSTASRWRDLDWLRRHGIADLRDRSDDLAVLGVMGPRSRALLSTLTGCDLSPEAFPFGAAREIIVAGQRALAVRITYVGELGWELHLPGEAALPVYDALKAAGACDAGHYAINAMRLEKAYRAFGHELSPADSPLQAGLAFAISWDHAFLGREALLREREEGPRKRLASLVIDDPEVMLWGGEPILDHRNDILGYTTSATFGPSIDRAVAMGYLPAALDAPTVFVQSGQRSHAARVLHRAPFDPKRRRVLC